MPMQPPVVGNIGVRGERIPFKRLIICTSWCLSTLRCSKLTVLSYTCGFRGQSLRRRLLEKYDERGSIRKRWGFVSCIHANICQSTTLTCAWARTSKSTRKKPVSGNTLGREMLIHEGTLVKKHKALEPTCCRRICTC